MNLWISNLVAYLTALGGILVLTPLAISCAKKWGIIDLPGARRVHQSPTPRTGGIAIACATLGASLIGLIVNAGRGTSVIGSEQLIAFFSCVLFIFGIGLIDDIVGLSSQYKLIALLAAALFVCGSGSRIDSFGFNNHVLVHFGAFAWPITVLWIIGVTVSINFIDGLDGLAAGLAAIACAALAIGASSTGATTTLILTLCLLGSLTGFLFYNFNPAKIFMGDSGSMFVGFTLASLSVMSMHETGRFTVVVLPALTLSIPFLDSLLTFFRRGVLERRSLFSAEKGHIHHRLLNIGLCQKHVVLILYAVTLVAGSVAVMVHFGTGWAKVSGLGLLFVILLGLFRSAGTLRAREMVGAIRQSRSVSRRIKGSQSAFEEMQLRFRNAVTFQQWWKETCVAAEMLSVMNLSLPITNRDRSIETLTWVRDETELNDCDRIHAKVPIGDRRPGKAVTVSLDIAVSTTLEVAGHQLALFSRLMGEHSIATLPQSGADGREVRPEFEVLAKTDSESGEMSLPPQVRIAVVHDFLYIYAGAERVLEQLLAVFPHADVFSLFDFLPAGQRKCVRNKTVKTSFIQQMPFAKSKHRAYLPLMPLAIEQLDLSSYDVIISSSYLVAKGVLTRSDQMHICYCHSPVRFAWDLQSQYLNDNNLRWGPKALFVRGVLHYIRNWDSRSSNGVDLFLANSNYVGRRIQKVYRRSSVTVYPPVDLDSFTLSTEKSEFYVTASRLVSYKRIDLVVEAFNQMPGKRLIVIGEGPDLEKIKAMACSNVRVLGHQPLERLRRYLQQAKAFVFAAEEDFGIAPVEAQACGTPVIAYGRGGVTESVIDGETGIYFMEQTAEAIIQAVKDFEERTHWNPELIRANAQRFTAANFRRHIGVLIRREWISFNSKIAIRQRRESITPDQAETQITKEWTPSFEPSTSDPGKPSIDAA